MPEMKERYYIKCYPEFDPHCLHYVRVENKGKGQVTIKHTHRRKEATLMTEEFAKFILDIHQKDCPEIVFRIVKTRM